MARVAVIFTGGTIASLPDATGAAMPALDPDAILARIPGIFDLADLEPIDRGLVPASHLRFAAMLDLARLLRSTTSRRGIDGVVLVQGTDSMEETAFAFDMLVQAEQPIVVVGAMRTSADAGWDGPRNMRDAVRVAASPDARSRGVLVVMGGLILPADDAAKMHSHADEAFAAPNSGPLGSVSVEGMVWHRMRGPRRSLAEIPERVPEGVLLVTATVGMDGALVRAARALQPAGLVIAATGSGNTHPDLLAGCVEMMAEGTPVCLTTRCPAGRAAPAYGFPGGGARWVEAGAMLGGHLNGPKARVALALGLGAGLQHRDLRDLLADPDGWHVA